jgi:putative SOS response-associated peptidase YedK
MVPVVIDDQGRRVTLMRWGLIPHWATDEKMGYKMINARAETLTTRPAYRGLLARHRCIIPASGFYEWKAEGRGKIPYYIHPAHDEFVAFAGLYDVWQPDEKKEVSSVTIITTEADVVVGRVHNRMPVILPRELEGAWLDPSRTGVSDALEILRASHSVPVEAYPISTRVNKPSVDEASLIEPIEKTGH